MSATLSARGSQEHGELRDRQTCNHHDTPVIYTLAGCEVCVGQRMSMLGRQSSLYERFPIGKLSQPVPYAGPYRTEAHNQHEPKHWGGPIISPDPLSGHPPGRLSPRRTGILSQRPHDRSIVACLTGELWHRPRGPSTYRDRLSWPWHTVIHKKRQKKFKLRTTNRWSNRVPHSARWPWQWRHLGGQCWRDLRQLRLYRVSWKLTHELIQHAGPWGTHQKTVNDAQGIEGRDQCHRLTKYAFIPHW